MKPNQTPEGRLLGELAKGEAKMNYLSPAHSRGGAQVDTQGSEGHGCPSWQRAASAYATFSISDANSRLLRKTTTFRPICSLYLNGYTFRRFKHNSQYKIFF